MYYKLDDQGYFSVVSFGGILPDGRHYEGELPADFTAHFTAYRLDERGQLVFDSERAARLREKSALDAEAREISRWLAAYDQKLAEARRCERLGLPAPDDLTQLDAAARLKQLRLEEIQQLQTHD